MRHVSKKFIIARLVLVGIGVPLLLLFLNWFSGPDIHTAFARTLEQFVDPRSGPFIWAILALTTFGFVLLLRPILRFYFCELESRSPDLETQNLAMRRFNLIPILIIAIGVGGNMLGLAAELFTASRPPSTMGSIIYALGKQVALGLMMATLIIFNFEAVLLPAKKLLGERQPTVKQGYFSFFLKISLAFSAMLLFFAFGIFDSSASVFMYAANDSDQPANWILRGGRYIELGRSDGVRNAIEVQGLKIFLLVLLGVHMLMLIKQQIRGPLGIIRSRLAVMNSGEAVLARKIDIVNNDEFTPVFREINRLVGRQQEELSSSKGRLEDLVHYAADAILSFDSNARIVIANPAASQMFGYSSEEFRSLKMSKLILLPQSLAQRCELDPKLVIEHFEEQETRPFRMTGITSSGREFELETNFSKVQSASGEWLFTAIIRDISAHVDLEQTLLAAKVAAEDSNKLKSEFLANMSHELRTPLNAILGFTQLMNDDKNLTSAQVAKLQTINSSGEHLLDLINDILDISKIEAGKYEIHEEVFDLPEFIKTLGDMFTLKSQEKGLQLYIETLGDMPRYVRGDLGKIRQVIINLLGNAVKFTAEGGVSMTVGVVEGSKNIRFAISDTGIGISETDRNAITRPFTQAKSARNEGGTGLGLAISSRFISMLGGRLEIESELGRGSNFSFELALPAADQGPDRREGRGRNLGLAPGVAAPRVLVVDDKESNRLILCEMLDRVGAITTQAVDGSDAVARAGEFKPDLIFMDIKMPVMDGYQAVSQLKKDPALAKIPVFALTASAFKHDEAKILSSGFTGFLAKPFKMSRLFALIEEHTATRFRYEEEPGNGQSHAASDWRKLPTNQLAEGFDDALLEGLEAALAINDFGELGRLLAEADGNSASAAKSPKTGDGSPSRGTPNHLAKKALEAAASSYDEAGIAEILAEIRRGTQTGADL